MLHVTLMQVKSLNPSPAYFNRLVDALPPGTSDNEQIAISIVADAVGMSSAFWVLCQIENDTYKRAVYLNIFKMLNDPGLLPSTMQSVLSVARHIVHGDAGEVGKSQCFEAAREAVRAAVDENYAEAWASSRRDF